jgi:hypothetical protein
MRVFLMLMLAAGLTANPAMAGRNPGDDDSAKAKKKAASDETKKNTDKPASSIDTELQIMRDTLQAQAQQLEAQRVALEEQKREIEDLKVQVVMGPRLAPDVPAGSSAVPGGATDGNATLATAAGGRSNPEGQDKNEPVTAIHFKGITLTPGGFFAAETVWRNRGLGADVNTPFNTIPFPGSSQSKLTEFNASGRQSRISMLAEGDTGSLKLTGYYEMDFLSAGVTSTESQSNSYTLRQRQFWAQAALNNGWTFTGGQMWSLVTETKKGVSNRTEAPPMTIDSQYSAGFSWARQYGFRVSKDFGDKVWLAFSVEEPQTTFTAHGNANNLIIGTPGASGGLFNSTANYSLNATPDFIVKAAFEPGWGHYEIFGVINTFRSRFFPCATASMTTPCPINMTITSPSAFGAGNNTRTGGGIGANARVPLFAKKVELGLHILGGGGINRYGTTGLPDATARPDGTLALIRGGQALGTMELHPMDKLDVYFNVGGEYAARAWYINTSGGAEGYGSPKFNNTGCSTEQPPTNQFTPPAPSSCTGDTRNIIEGTFGFWYRFYKGDRGTLQWGPQYSYVVRNTWSGTGGEPRSNENMFFTSFRYYLP